MLPRSQLILWPEYLSHSSDLPEILWYFSHYGPKDERRLALAQNPNFYNTLPTSSAGYMGIGPIEFPNDLSCPAFDVLTNDCGRVFLERNPQPRIFDNLWDINGIIIFKGSCLTVISGRDRHLSRRLRKARGWTNFSKRCGRLGLQPVSRTST